MKGPQEQLISSSFLKDQRPRDRAALQSYPVVTQSSLAVLSQGVPPPAPVHLLIPTKDLPQPPAGKSPHHTAPATPGNSAAVLPGSTKSTRLQITPYFSPTAPMKSKFLPSQIPSKVQHEAATVALLEITLSFYFLVSVLHLTLTN